MCALCNVLDSSFVQYEQSFRSLEVNSSLPDQEAHCVHIGYGDCMQSARSESTSSKTIRAVDKGRPIGAQSLKSHRQDISIRLNCSRIFPIWSVYCLSNAVHSIGQSIK